MSAKNCIGDRFGRLVIVGPAGVRKEKTRWQCRCDCGVVVVVTQCNLRGGNTKSCGCFRREVKRTHGATTNRKRTAAYRVWGNMIQRCTNAKTAGFPDYGGRGIAVCKRWRNSFEAFLADMGQPPKGMTLDRKNNDGPYSPGNCRWATHKEQSRNQRRNRLVSWRGQTQCVSAWAEECGISVKVLAGRLEDGWPVEAALTVPVSRSNRIALMNGD